MRLVFALLGLLIALAIVGWLARARVETGGEPVVVPMPDGTSLSGSPRQIEQQYKKALEDAMNTTRVRSPDE